ncbi:MAG: hypothetical protein AAF728_19280 [Cyanobacteria bacterium P01_D01_bin.128]
MAFPYRSFVVLMLTLAAASLASCSSSEISEREGEVDESALADIPEPTVAYACGSFADCEAVERLRNAQYAVPDVGLGIAQPLYRFTIRKAPAGVGHRRLRNIS